MAVMRFFLPGIQTKARSPAVQNLLVQLAAIPGVLDYTIKRQTSPKLDHAFGISMRFAGREDHDACNAHPLHARFPEEHQFREVTDFEEL